LSFVVLSLLKSTTNFGVHSNRRTHSGIVELRVEMEGNKRSLFCWTILRVFGKVLDSPIDPTETWIERPPELKSLSPIVMAYRSAVPLPCIYAGGHQMSLYDLSRGPNSEFSDWAR
jgi:hypothetical protein